MASKLKLLDSPLAGEAAEPINWFADVSTPAGPARFWRFIPAEQFAQLKHFQKYGVDVKTLGDVPFASEDARWEVCKFLGRSLIETDRVVHRYQGEVGPLKISAWPDGEILRLAKDAALFHGLRAA